MLIPLLSYTLPGRTVTVNINPVITKHKVNPVVPINKLIVEKIK